MRELSFWQIFSFVSALHIAGVILLHLNPPPIITPTPKKQTVLAKTVVLNPKIGEAKQAIAAAPSTLKPKKEVKKKKESIPSEKIVKAPNPKKEKKEPSPKANVVKQASPKKEEKREPSSAEETVRASNPKKEKLLSEAQTALTQIGKGKHSSRLDQDEVPTLEIQPLFGEVAGYTFTLIRELERLLHLPDRGEVSINLTLSREGKVLSLEILSSKSSRNHQKVAAQLPSLKFPPFDDSLGTAQEQTFNILLKNT